MRRVCDRAGLQYTSPYRCTGCCLPHNRRASASRSKQIFAAQYPTPVNASTPPSREAPHDSGPVWVASPSPCDSFIHCTSPVCAGAPCCFASPPVGADQTCVQPSRTFTSGLPTVWSPAPSPDITTVPTGQPALAGLSPARPSISFTELSRRTVMACLRQLSRHTRMYADETATFSTYSHVSCRNI